METKPKFLHNITIISGNKDAGKTSLCRLLREMITLKGKSVSGVISPGLYQNNRKSGILAEDITSHESRQIAVYAPGWDKNHPEREWQFNENAIQWANMKLENTVPTDYLIIDEIGYLELEENRGWTAAVKGLKRGQFNHAFVVIRPELVKIAQTLWGETELVIVKTEDDLVKLADRLLAHLSEAA